MTVSGIIIMLVIGILMLIVGAITKKQWVLILSILPLAIALAHILLLAMM